MQQLSMHLYKNLYTDAKDNLRASKERRGRDTAPYLIGENNFR